MSDPHPAKTEKANPFEAVPIEVTVSVGRARAAGGDGGRTGRAIGCPID